jgi:hypothetical protein
LETTGKTSGKVKNIKKPSKLQRNINMRQRPLNPIEGHNRTPENGVKGIYRPFGGGVKSRLIRSLLIN